MEETRVNVKDDANDHVGDVAVGEDFDSSQSKARSRKSYQDSDDYEEHEEVETD